MLHNPSALLVSLFRPLCSRSACLPSESDLFTPRRVQNLPQNCIRPPTTTTTTPAALFRLSRSYFQRLTIFIWSNESCNNSSRYSKRAERQPGKSAQILQWKSIDLQASETRRPNVARRCPKDSFWFDVCFVFDRTQLVVMAKHFRFCWLQGAKRKKNKINKKMAQCHINLQRTIHVVMSTSGKTFQWMCNPLRCTLAF